jgi:hypothetical protein
MLWAYLKISLSLVIPFSTVAYARQVRHEADCRSLLQIMRQPLNYDLHAAHPLEAIRQDRADFQHIHELLQDLRN